MIKYLFVGLISFILLDDNAGCLGSPDPLDDKTLEDAKKNGPSGSGGNNTFNPGNMNLVVGSGDVCSSKYSAVHIQCFDIYGQYGPYYFGEMFKEYSVAKLWQHGKWDNPSIKCDITLYADGTGKWHWQPTYTQQNRTDQIKWGVGLNKDGTMPGYSTGQCYVLLVNPNCKDLIDVQFGMGTFTFSNSSWNNGWQ